MSISERGQSFIKTLSFEQKLRLRELLFLINNIIEESLVDTMKKDLNSQIMKKGVEEK